MAHLFLDDKLWQNPVFKREVMRQFYGVRDAYHANDERRATLIRLGEEWQRLASALWLVP